MVANMPVWGKLLGAGIVLNEVRGSFVLAAGLTDLNAHGWQAQPHHWAAVPLLLVPVVAVAVWKAHKRRARIRRRFDDVADH